MRVFALLFAIVALSTTVSAASNGTLVAPSGTTFHITAAAGAPGAFTGWLYTDPTQGILLNPTLNLTVGGTYIFSIDFLTVIHPFGFTLNGATGAAPAGTDFGALPAVVVAATNADCDITTHPNLISNTNGTLSCQFTTTLPAGVTVGQSAFYRCGIHPALSGVINVVAGAATAAPSSTTTNTGSSSSAATTSSAGATSSATTQAPSSTGTGHSAAGRVTVIPGLAIVLAAVVALFA